MNKKPSYQQILVLTLVGVLGATIFATGAVAHEQHEERVSDILQDREQLELLIDRYNERIDNYDGQYASLAKQQVGGEVVNVFIEDDGEQYAYSARVTDDLHVTQFKMDSRNDASITARTDVETIVEVYESDNRRKAVREAWRDNRITVTKTESMFEELTEETDNILEEYNTDEILGDLDSSITRIKKSLSDYF